MMSILRAKWVKIPYFKMILIKIFCLFSGTAFLPPTQGLANTAFASPSQYADWLKAEEWGAEQNAEYFEAFNQLLARAFDGLGQFSTR